LICAPVLHSNAEDWKNVKLADKVWSSILFSLFNPSSPPKLKLVKNSLEAARKLPTSFSLNTRRKERL
jgi:hypothetical protein